MLKVLFLCTENACRSQMAEGLVNHDLAGERFNLVITVCDQAREQCPLFPGDTEVMHVGFPDPARAAGPEEEIMAAFRQVRDSLREQLVPLLRKRSRSNGD